MPDPDPQPPPLSTPRPSAWVEIVDSTGELPAHCLAWLTEHAAACLAFMKTAGELRVRVVGDAEMAAMHVRHTGIEGTTDVLTFDLREPGQPEQNTELDSILYAIDTDIVACLDVARRHAGPGGYPVEHELLLYIVHGVLHCIGHDDHADDQAMAMHAEEDRILRAIGVGSVFTHGLDSAHGSPRPDGEGGAQRGGTSG